MADVLHDPKTRLSALAAQHDLGHETLLLIGRATLPLRPPGTGALHAGELALICGAIETLILAGLHGEDEIANAIATARRTRDADWPTPFWREQLLARHRASAHALDLVIDSVLGPRRSDAALAGRELQAINDAFEALLRSGLEGEGITDAIRQARETGGEGWRASFWSERLALAASATAPMARPVDTSPDPSLPSGPRPVAPVGPIEPQPPAEIEGGGRRPLAA